MELRRDTWDRWHSSPTYLAGGHCALPVPVVTVIFYLLFFVFSFISPNLEVALLFRRFLTD